MDCDDNDANTVSDDDGDGYYVCDDDCDDTDVASTLDIDVWYDGIDSDRDRQVTLTKIWTERILLRWC